MGRLPDALGPSFGPTIPTADTDKQKESGNAPLFAFLGREASDKNGKVAVDVDVYPLQKSTHSKKTQVERSRALSGTKRHGKRKKVRTNGVSKSAMDWHVHYASQAPGPGTYAPKDIQARRICTVVLHSGPADRSVGGGGGGHEDGPGPQEYDAISALDAVRPRFVGGVLSKTKPRTDAMANEYNAPPTYMIDRDPRYRPPAFSFGNPSVTKSRKGLPDVTPSPADYNVLKRRTKSAGGRFSRAEQSYFDSREFKVKAGEPGPGDFDVIYPGDKKPDCCGKISKHKPKSLDEKLLEDAAETPGPGLYNTDPGYHTPSARFGKSGAKSALDWIIYYAGKNQSEHAGGLVKPPRIYGGRFSTSRKVNMTEQEEKRARSIPGPSDYVLPSTLIIPGGTWGKAIDKEEVEDKHKGPGPGDYDTTSALDKVRPRVVGGKVAWLGGTLWRQEALDAKAKIPGPSDYYGATAALDHTSTVKLPRDIRLGRPSRRGFEGHQHFRVAKILIVEELPVQEDNPNMRYQKLYLDVAKNKPISAVTTAPNLSTASLGKCLVVAMPGATVNGSHHVEVTKELGVENAAVVLSKFTENMQWAAPGLRALLIPESFEPGELAPLNFTPGPLDYKTVEAMDSVKPRQGTGCKMSTSLKADLDAYANKESAAVPGPGYYDIPNTVRGTDGCPFPGGRVYPDRGLFLRWQEETKAGNNTDGA